MNQTEPKQVFRADGTNFPQEIREYFTPKNLLAIQAEGCRFAQGRIYHNEMCFDGDEYIVHKFDEQAFENYFMRLKEESQMLFFWEPKVMSLAKIPASREQVLLAIQHPDKFQGFKFSFRHNNVGVQFVATIRKNDILVQWISHETNEIMDDVFSFQSVNNGVVIGKSWVIDEPEDK
jgi:hypothetical protein